MDEDHRSWGFLAQISCVFFAMKTVLTVFLSGSRNQGFCSFSRGHSQSLTMSPPFLLFQGKEMMLFPASPFVFLD